MILRVAVSAGLVLGLTASACGGSVAAQSATAAAQGVTEQVSANNRTPQLDPRNNDPTAAQAIGERPGAGSAGLSLSNSKSSQSTGSASTTSAGTTAAANEPDPDPAPGDTPTKISARHVLIQYMGSDRAGKSVLRTKDQALNLAQEVLKRARAGEDIGRLANEYSDEPNAGARGGSLGRFSRGQMVPAFDQVAFKLRVGQISDIVETPFGFHIIQRTE
jgi:parvulin-like peptidyl-prolyl isomerase